MLRTVMLSRPARQLLSLAPLVASLACTNFDREDRIADTRILAVRTEPAEVLYSPLYLTRADQRPPLPLPTTDVKVELFAFDPRGGRMETSIQMCPENSGDSSCRLYDEETDLAAEPESARPELRTLLAPRTFEEDIAINATPLGRTSPSQFDYAFTPAAIDFFIADDADGNPLPSVFPLLPRFVAQVTNLDAADAGAAVSRERAFKRIPVGLDLTSSDLPPEVAAQFASALGFTLCEAPTPPEDFVEGEAACLEPRAPNANPSLLGFYVEPDSTTLRTGQQEISAACWQDAAACPEQPTEPVVDDPATPDVDESVPPAPRPTIGPGALLKVKPGMTLGLTPVFLEGVSEHYQIISFDIVSSALLLKNRIEDLACQWYTSRGELSATATAIQFNSSLGVTWSVAPACAANQDPAEPFLSRGCALPGDRDSLYLVVLDQRGGTTVGEVTVEYTE